MPEALACPGAIATADCFVKCPDRRAICATHSKADLVDMETAAVAQIAALLDIPWARIKASDRRRNSDKFGRLPCQSRNGRQPRCLIESPHRSLNC